MEGTIIALQSQISCNSVQLAIGNSKFQILRWCGGTIIACLSQISCNSVQLAIGFFPYCKFYVGAEEQLWHIYLKYLAIRYNLLLGIPHCKFYVGANLTSRLYRLTDK